MKYFWLAFVFFANKTAAALIAEWGSLSHLRCPCVLYNKSKIMLHKLSRFG